MDVLCVLIPRGDLAGVDHVGLAAAEGLAVGPEIGVGAESEDFGRVDGSFGVVGAGRAGLKWMRACTAATSVGASSAVKNEFSSEDWAGDGESFVAREGIRVVVIGTGVDLVVAIIFIEDQPGIDVGDVAGDVDFLSEDEDLWEVIYSIVGFLGDINIAINREGTIYEHSESIHEFLASGITSSDEIAITIELIEIGGTIHGAETGIPLMIELGEAEIILGRSFVGSEAIDSVTRISGDSVAEAGLQAS